MSDDFSLEIEGPITQEAIQAKLREYQENNRRIHAAARARLEDSSIEPAQQAAYEATLAEMMALRLEELTWPSKDPMWPLHRAMEYGAQLESRRDYIEERFDGRLPLECMYSINRYALATLHAFKMWRANPEPDGSFVKVVRDAAHLRYVLGSEAAALAHRGLLAPDELRPYDGGVTPQIIACDLFLLTGIFADLPTALRARMFATPLELMEGALLGKSLLKAATRAEEAELWQPTLLYARAYTLVDRASYHAELALAELHNEERDPDHFTQWEPGCLFCSTALDRQHHHRDEETPKQARRRASFISATMTAALRGEVVEN